MRALDEKTKANAPAPGPAPSDGRVSRARRQREERRAQLLGTALRLFAERGYHATSIDDIIKASKVARGTFYLYFESKRALFDEVLDSFFQTIAGAVRRVDTSPGAPPPLDQVHAIVRRIFSVLDEQRPMARILIREAVGLDDEFDRKLGDFYGRVAGLVERALRNGIAMGLVRELDPPLVAYCVLGSVKEVIDRVFVGGAEVDLESASRALVEFNLRAVFR